MIELDIFHHVCDSEETRKPFIDGYFFYRFEGDEYPTCLNARKICRNDVKTDPIHLSAKVTTLQDSLSYYYKLLDEMLALVNNLSENGKTFQPDIDSVKMSDDYRRLCDESSELQRVIFHFLKAQVNSWIFEI